jgi:hypothetical protein
LPEGTTNQSVVHTRERRPQLANSFIPEIA